QTVRHGARASCSAGLADQIAQLIELGHNFRLGVRAGDLLARIALCKQPLDDVGARTGETDKSHGAVAVFQRKSNADAERIAVLRTMTIGAQPLRAAALERLLELARRQTEDGALFLVFHEALRKRLGIGATISRYAVFRADRAIVLGLVVDRFARILTISRELLR